MFYFASFSVAVTSALSLITVYFYTKNMFQKWVFISLSLLVSLHFTFLPISVYSTSSSEGIFFIKLVHICSSFIASLSFIFVLNITYDKRRKYFYAILSIASAFSSSYFVFFHEVIKDVKPFASLPFWTVPGKDFYVYLIHYTLFSSMALILLILNQNHIDPEKQRIIKIILPGACIAILSAWTLFLPGWGILIEPYGIFGIIAFQLSMMIGICKNAFSKTSIYISKFLATVILLGLLLLMIIFISLLIGMVQGATQ